MSRDEERAREIVNGIIKDVLADVSHRRMGSCELTFRDSKWADQIAQALARGRREENERIKEKLCDSCKQAM
jgi:hypothetical protein